MGAETPPSPTLLVTALGIVPDVARCTTMDLKRAENSLFLLGSCRAELGGSLYHALEGQRGGVVPEVDLARAPRTLAALHRAIQEGWIASCHDLSEGGLSVAAAEMAFGGGLGLDLDLARSAFAARLGLDPERPGALRLFSESCTRLPRCAWSTGRGCASSFRGCDSCERSARSERSRAARARGCRAGCSSELGLTSCDGRPFRLPRMTPHEPDEPSPVRAPVLRSAGTNCDGQTVRGLSSRERRPTSAPERPLGRPGAALRLPDPHRGRLQLRGYVAAGRVLGLEIRQRLSDPLRRFIESGGFVLGICNGFQILVELGLFEPESAERRIALTDNASNRFECRWVTLRSERCAAPWIEPGELMPVPVAHGEGRLVVRDPGVLEELFARGQVALTYVDPENPPTSGATSALLPYPVGTRTARSPTSPACVIPRDACSASCPTPERNLSPLAASPVDAPRVTEAGEGLAFYQRMVAAAASHTVSSA